MTDLDANAGSLLRDAGGERPPDDLIERCAQLRATVREHTPGLCKILSLGDACPCDLCAVDALAARLREQAEEIARLTEQKQMSSEEHTVLDTMLPIDALIIRLRATSERDRMQDVIDAAKAMREWISRIPHGDNCFVSNHYEGDPGNQCNCGKTSIVDMADAALAKLERGNG